MDNAGTTASATASSMVPHDQARIDAQEAQGSFSSGPTAQDLAQSRALELRYKGKPIGT